MSKDNAAIPQSRRTAITRVTAAALAVSLPLGFGAARAHTDKPHSKKGPVRKEQKDWGIAGDASAVRRTITVRMTDDMKFAPATITVTEGETLRIRAVNAGKVLHEIVLGTQAELDAHAELMRKHPNMEHD